jgi:hypothetical protein
MGLAEGNQDTIGCSDKSPEEKNDHKGTQCTVIRGLFGLVHVVQAVLVTVLVGMKIARNH